MITLEVEWIHPNLYRLLRTNDCLYNLEEHSGKVYLCPRGKVI